MRNPIKYFSQIMRIEMEDLQEDLEYMIEKAKEDFESGKITERVFLENQTLFKNEIMGVIDFNNFLAENETDQFEDLDSMVIFFKYHFREIAKINGFANALIICVERKIEKVTNYITQPSKINNPGGLPC